MNQDRINELVNPSRAALEAQWRLVLEREWPALGKRQKRFVPAETLMCLFASTFVPYRRFGSTTAHRAPSPVPELARLFKRSPGSVLAKMSNLDGGFAHGQRGEPEAAEVILRDRSHLEALYEKVLNAARAAGIDGGDLPDFLPRTG